jgi:uncharacterized protein (TIGR00730 family)
MIKSVVIFCGSGNGKNPSFLDMAFETGKFLATKNINVIYGGAKIGLMGAVADGALSVGGKVIGVIPDFLAGKEIRHDNLTEKFTVTSMHDRKLMMSDLCNGVIALPGGFGTMDELFEMLTWAQLGLHQKPIGLLNFNGYYDHLLKFVNSMLDENFISASNRSILLEDSSIEQLLIKMQSYTAPPIPQWMKRDQV